jgi:signal transduction histidine kinase
MSIRTVKIDRDKHLQVTTSTDDGVSKQDQDQYYQILDLAYIGSMLPGIIHNLSTPLSGVMGATQLLEMRSTSLEDMLKEINELDESARQELQKQFDRSRMNVDIIARNAKVLSDILHVLVQRVSRGGLSRSDSYSLNDLLQNELRFLDANLDFKHKVKKSIQLAPDVHLVEYVYCHVANAIEEFVSEALKRHDFKQKLMEMDFVTTTDETHMTLTMTARLTSNSIGIPHSLSSMDVLNRLREAGWNVDQSEAPETISLTLSCPRRLRRA